MTDLKIFEKAGVGSVRVVMREGDPWFVARDVCDILGTEAEDISRILDADEYAPLMDTIRTLNDSRGLRKDSRIVSEAGLYSLVLRSRKPEAKAFKRWITHEVIPAIRKFGGYLTPDKVEEVLLNPDTVIRLATALKEEQARRAALEAKTEADRPKVLFAESVSASTSSILIGQLANLISQNGVKIGQNRLFQWMRGNDFLIANGSRRNSPTQRAMEMGLFEVKERTINNPDGSIRITLTTKVTGKGQIYFVNRFLKETKAA